MINISQDKFYVSDVEDYIKSKSTSSQTNKSLEVVNVHSTSFNNGTGRDYQFCTPIKHPETGKELRPVRGYIGYSEDGQDRCYYAEFVDEDGKPYCYTYQFAEYNEKTNKYTPAKSISKQMKEDSDALEEKLASEAGAMGM